MRRFGMDRMEGMMTKLSPDDAYPIENALITRQIESAQKRVESTNYETRKNVLRYDDVMNKQREIIYGERRKVLMGEDLRDQFTQMIDQTVENIVNAYASEHSMAEEWGITSIEKELSDLCATNAAGVLHSADLKHLSDLMKRCKQFVASCREKKEAEIKEQGIDMREVERIMLLRAVDTNWMDHIDAMDQLKQGIGLRAYAQTDPATAYANEGADLFDAMIERIREEAVKNLLRVQVRKAPIERKEVAKPIDTPSPDGAKPKVLKRSMKIGRNDPCPCGSGKKYKNCCGRNA